MDNKHNDLAQRLQQDLHFMPSIFIIHFIFLVRLDMFPSSTTSQS